MNGESEDIPPTDEVRVRHAPRIGMFLLAGAVVGAIAAFILTIAFPIDENVGFGPTFGLLLVYSVPIGIALAAVIAIIIDWTSSRRAAVAIAEREEVRDMDAAGRPEPGGPQLNRPEPGEQPGTEPGQPEPGQIDPRGL